jgi:hypothetical protein
MEPRQKRLATALARTADEPPQQICDDLVATLVTGSDHRDDVAIVVARLLSRA